ncbi:CCA tRNA nucleotidyltransferase [Anaerotardibacter muris]|uniref:CCA tRNA nucleotidyltransferase n=1 Tax=Anaerotardibacter muris TaxID=2941505 RepID=UPI00203C8460|nr:HD domain-containing protein [Anaerotardibacter muris]
MQDGNTIDQTVQRVIDTLEDAGYETWLVGGFVRDLLLERPLHDFDLATAAPWQKTKELCLDAGWAVHETGTKHGTLTVVANDHVLEITTFRTEGTYLDHRRPSEVAFTNSIEEDLARRDFTVNAMAFHPERGLLDPFGGQEDLRKGVIRCVGDARTRFSEDALRILRGLRFASQLGFSLEDATLKAALAQRDDLLFIAGERIEDELTKLLCGQHALHVLMNYTDILNVVLPELVPMEGLDQKTKYHIYDVFEHTAYVVHYSPATPLSRWAGLLHDAGKPDTFFTDEDGVGHMYGHPKVSVEHVRAVAKRLRFSRAFTHDLALLVRYHDTRPAPTKKSIRRLYAKLDNKEYLFHALCDLMRADSLAQAPEYHSRVKITDELEALFEEMLADDEVFGLKDLAITGADLIAAGFPQGKQIGDALEAALEEVIEERLPNEKEALLSFTLDYLRMGR